MDRVRRELEKMRAESRGDSFELEGGSRYYLDLQPILAQEFVGFTSACIRADYARQMRPEPHRYYRALCKAKDRREAIRLYFPKWTPEDTQHPNCPFNVWTLVFEGRLEDMPFAPSGWIDGEWKDLTPIPYTPVAAGV